MQELVPSQTQRLLDDQWVAHVAVIADGVPYVTPVSYVWLDQRLWFRSAEGRRLDALLSNPRVGVEISDFDTTTGHWQSILIDGTARVVEDGDQVAQVEKAMRDKYRRLSRSALEMSPDTVPLSGTVLAVDVHELSGRASGNSVISNLRPGRL